MRAGRLAAVLAACAGLAAAGSGSAVTVASAASAASAAVDPPAPVKHVFVIVLENKSFDQTFGFNSAAPYLSQTLAGQGALLPNYYGVTHESMGNYIALVSGQGSNPITQTDCQVYAPLLPGTLGADGQALGAGCVYPAAVKTIADQLDGAGLRWKGYMEDMGNAAGEATTCAHPGLLQPDSTQSARVGDQYAARHNPFVYFPGGDGSACCNEPQFPNTANNGGSNIGRGGGRTGAVLLSPFIDPGTVDNVAYNHFTLLRSFEDLFGLGHLGYAGMPGLSSLGADAFTCYRAVAPRSRHARLARGSEIKLAVIGQGTARRPMVEVKLWHPGRVSVQVLRVRRSTRRRSSAHRVLAGQHRRPHHRRSRRRRVGRPHRLVPCQLLTVGLPTRHGTAVISVAAFHGVERRTIQF